MPDGDTEPGLFQQSLGFVDKDGNEYAIATIDNDYPPPRGRGLARGPLVPSLLPKVVQMMLLPRRPIWPCWDRARSSSTPTPAHHSTAANYTGTFTDIEGV